MKFLFPSLCAVLVGAAAQSAIITDLEQRISPQITITANELNGVPASGLRGALAVDSDLKTLTTVFDSATGNAKDEGSFSESDGETIIADLSSAVDALSRLLNQFSTTKAAFDGFVPPVSPIILGSLTSLNQSAVEYSGVLVDEAPAEQVSTFTAVKNTLANAFAQTLAIYGSDA